MKRLLAMATLTCCLCSLTQTGHAALANHAKTPTTQQLNSVRHQIHKIEQSLTEDRKKQQQLGQLLQHQELAINQLGRKLHQLQDEHQQQQQALQTLQKKRRQLLQRRSANTVNLAKQVQTRFKLGRQQQLVLLLNMENPSQVSRYMTYLNHLNKSRLTLVAAHNQLLQTLEQLRESSIEKITALEKINQQHSQKRQQMRQELATRAAILAQVSQSIRTKTDQLSNLKEDESRLNKILEQLPKVLADIPHSLPKLNFGKHRGRIPYPTVGQITHSFGSQRVAGMKYAGIIIAAPEGQEVRAVYSGRVAYADWLRGFGLLTIIDHGDGYMTLYANNQSLYKDRGDWVASGEVIAGVGSSGGIDKPGLYFEIRKKGHPMNPTKWISKKIQHHALSKTL